MIKVRAPSNIALIKYMGKKDPTRNLPENASISMTLNDLCSVVEVERSDEVEISEAPPAFDSRYPLVRPILNDLAIEKIRAHFERVRSAFESRQKGFKLKTANTFPAASGIASSASSFAAMTTAFAQLCTGKTTDEFRSMLADPKFRDKLADLSRQGSGSSCRSFDGPFVMWDRNRIEKINSSQIPKLSHFVVLISSSEKSVSSSEAHLRVKTSPAWGERIQRIGARTVATLHAIENADLQALSKLAWVEAWEVHNLFHTAAESFSYWKPKTVELLHALSEDLKSENPPIVTLDAGPNVHVIVKEEFAVSWREKLSKFGKTLEDKPGGGVEIL